MQTAQRNTRRKARFTSLCVTERQKTHCVENAYADKGIPYSITPLQSRLCNTNTQVGDPAVSTHCGSAVLLCVEAPNRRGANVTVKSNFEARSTAVRHSSNRRRRPLLATDGSNNRTIIARLNTWWPQLNAVEETEKGSLTALQAWQYSLGRRC